MAEYEYEYLLFEYYSNTELFAHLCLCPQEMPLNFVGDKQWVVYKKDYHSGHRTKVLVLF